MKPIFKGALIVTLLTLSVLGCGKKMTQAARTNPVDPNMSVHSFDHPDINGNSTSLKDYEGQVVLLVNTATYCGYTPQFEGLQKLHEAYASRGFSVIGFPCNDFGGQDPDPLAQIQEFCSSKYSVTFPMFSKVNAKGDKTALYRYLTEEGPNEYRGEIPWNFTKFLVNGEGQVIGRFEPGAEPMSDEITGAVEAEIAKLQ